MTRRSNRKPPADKAGGASQYPVASAPDMATGLVKYFTPQLVALTGGTMDAPVSDPKPIFLLGADVSPHPVRGAPWRKTAVIRHRKMTFVCATPNPPPKAEG